MRAFIAVDVSDKSLLYEQAKRYWKMLERIGANYKKVIQDNFHVTLLFLGEIDKSYASSLCELIREINFKPFFFTVVGFSSFGNRVAFFDIKEQDYFKTLLSTFSSKLSLKNDRFHAHITISRIKNKVTLPDVTIEPITIKAENLCLFKSTLTSSGPIYERLCCSYEVKRCKNEI